MFLLFVGFALVLSPIFVGKAGASEIIVKFFWAEGCPHCAHEHEFFEGYLPNNPDVKVEAYEVSKNRENQMLMVELGKELGADVSGVPFTVIGREYIIGYAEGTTDKKIIEAIDKNRPKEPDPQPEAKAEELKIQENVDQNDQNGADSAEEVNSSDKELINLPVLGEIDIKTYSLPALSIIIGLLDGFNPCAMWTLLFLISMLLGMKDKKRMWILGTAFIVASALVYFVFMAAWLNLFLFIGLIAAVRIVIGLVAVGGGAYNLRDFFVNKDATCKVTSSTKRQKVFEKIKNVIHKKSFFMALVGIVLLAFAVNLVELICSAGLPAVYTQILSLSDLSKWQYYFYIFLYILFFMLDDLFVFVVAMVTLQLTGITTKYSRLSKLIGGVILFVIGVILIFKPEWLMFG
jgi:thiol-disulfide isomerase/thioredoxin